MKSRLTDLFTHHLMSWMWKPFLFYTVSTHFFYFLPIFQISMVNCWFERKLYVLLISDFPLNTFWLVLWFMIYEWICVCKCNAWSCIKFFIFFLFNFSVLCVCCCSFNTFRFILLLFYSTLMVNLGNSACLFNKEHELCSGSFLFS